MATPLAYDSAKTSPLATCCCSCRSPVSEPAAGSSRPGWPSRRQAGAVRQPRLVVVLELADGPPKFASLEPAVECLISMAAGAKARLVA